MFLYVCLCQHVVQSQCRYLSLMCIHMSVYVQPPVYVLVSNMYRFFFVSLTVCETAKKLHIMYKIKLFQGIIIWMPFFQFGL